MKIDFNKQKNTYFLIFLYFFSLVIVFLNLQDQGIHIEEKFHRLNGLYWLSYILEIFGIVNLQEIVDIKISQISDYSLSRVTEYNKYGVIFDLPLAILEVCLEIEDVRDVYYLKHFLSFVIFLISSYIFFKILLKSNKNFFFSFAGLGLYLTTPRIFGDSFFYKDILFLSFLIFVIHYFIKCIENLSLKNLIFLSLFCALAINLRIFSIIVPFLFVFTLIIKSFYSKNIFEHSKKIMQYFIFLFIFLYIFWPYLWSNPILNFIELFKSLDKNLIDIKILYDGNYISNRGLPDTYIFNWILISSPFLQSILFLIGYCLYFIRLGKRFIKIKILADHNDLWRGKKEEIDFIFFLFFTTFLILFLVLNAPFYNGWRLVYFLNIFIVYFIINFFSNTQIFFKNKKILRHSLKFLVILMISYNLNNIFKYHPFQSLYFNSLVSEKTKNSYEGDYHGIAAKEFFEKVLELDKNLKINIGVASHTPLQRGLEGLAISKRQIFKIVGQEYQEANYIFKNNISEVNSKLNKKYEVPKNFSKIYERKINNLEIYQIYKKM